VALEAPCSGQKGTFQMAEPLRIDPVDTNARLKAGEAIILDVVSPLAWEQLDRAIQGAVRIAPDVLSDRWGELPRERAIIAYCT
jgi:rhodanese-related sulfurtransferase